MHKHNDSPNWDFQEFFHSVLWGFLVDTYQRELNLDDDDGSREANLELYSNVSNKRKVYAYSIF